MAQLPDDKVEALMRRRCADSADHVARRCYISGQEGQSRNERRYASYVPEEWAVDESEDIAHSGSIKIARPD